MKWLMIIYDRTYRIKWLEQRQYIFKMPPDPTPCRLCPTRTLQLSVNLIIITTTSICHYYHHNHHRLSLLLSQPPPSGTIIITTINGSQFVSGCWGGYAKYEKDVWHWWFCWMRQQTQQSSGNETNRVLSLQKPLSWGKDTQFPHLSEIVECSFKEGSTKLFWKTSFAEPSYSQGEFVQKKYQKFIAAHEVVESHLGPRGD